jgi:uncharacterized cupin superfamily protein
MSKAPSFIDTSKLEKKGGSGYPEQYRGQVINRARARIGDLFGLTQFGVNIVTLPPGSWSSHRHWHQNEDEFIHVLEGEITLVDDDGAHHLTPGMCAGFKAGNGNGHHLQNNSTAPATYLEVGTRSTSDRVVYPDVDMQAIKSPGESWRFVKKDGSAF